jgi:thioredoxin-related protein
VNRRIVLGIAVVASFIGALSLVSKYSTAPTIDWERNFQSALARAQSGRMTVAVYLYTDWCRYCKQMDSETFSDAQVIAEVGRRYLWVRLNAEEDPDGARLRQEYGVRGFPTFILFDADGEWIDQLEGYLPPQEFGAALQSLTHGPDSFPRLKARVRESPGSVAMHYALGHRYLERRRYPQAEQEFSKIIAMDSRNDSGRTPAAIHNLAVSLAAQSRYSDALE